MAGRQETSGAGTKDHARALRIVAVRGDEDRGFRRCCGQQGDVGKVDMRAGRSTEQDYLKPLTAPEQLRQLDCRCDIGDVPAPRLLEKRQFEAFAAQRALIDDRKVAPNWADKPTVRTMREACLGSAEMIGSVQVNPSRR